MYLRVSRTDPETEGLQVIADERIRSDLELVEPLIQRILSRIRSDLPAPTLSADVDLALREAVVNAIVHGNKRNRAKQVWVTVRKGESDGLLVVVRDEGDGFDPARLATPLDGDRLYASGGRGIFLMRSLIKDVTFADGGREVRLRIA